MVIVCQMTKRYGLQHRLIVSENFAAMVAAAFRRVADRNVRSCAIVAEITRFLCVPVRRTYASWSVTSTAHEMKTTHLASDTK